ncbi:protein phosphatase 1 regulatory subunit 42-like [Eriocheir sinensis]|uniref:protein phosphatase 1 regulatory subunit 42-like n=1 Tax=Eriocheir sinensis TaxID=95602 RepID=UPI0021C83E7F|nr:protein phosphatase 1 regulatory subunit 42-like [Eriocheir sinensis]
MVGVNRETLWTWLGEQDRGRRTRKRRQGGKRPEDAEGGEEDRKEGGGKEREGGGNEEEEEEARRGEDEEDEEEKKEEERKMRESFLGRVTHLHLQNKGITHLEDVGACGGALVAYLQHNHLTRLANLRPLRHLQELYLQDNEITRLEGLREMCSLRRLLVSGNRVGVVEGLPRGLTELHVQDQRLPPGDALILDPHALAAVQDTLRVLDVSGNRLTEIGAVGLLGRLQVLQAAHNDLCSLPHLCTVLGRLPHLRLLTLSGNPVTAHRRYRPAAILAAADTMETLDDKQVTPQCREFIVQADRYRAARREAITHPPPSAAPPNTSVHPARPEHHLLFTPVTPADHPHGKLPRRVM